MGRFYRTSSAQPVDYMYRANIPLMQQVIQANDAGIDNLLGVDAKVGELASFPHLTQNDDEAKKITDYYTGKANEISDAIHKDPANWKKQQDNIRNLQREIDTDYKTGNISKYTSSYNNKKADFDAIDAQVELYNKTGGKDAQGNDIGIDPYTAQVYKNAHSNAFKGGKDELGNINIYQGKPVMGNMDIQAHAEKGLKDMKDSGQIIESPTQKGLYIITQKGKIDGVTQDRIIEAMSANLSDPQLRRYEADRSSVGLLSGIYDDKGKYIDPYGYSPVDPTDAQVSDLKLRQAKIDQLQKKDPQKAQQLQEELNADAASIQNKRKFGFTPGSYIAGIMQGAIGKYAHSEIEQSTTMATDQAKVEMIKMYNTNGQEEKNRQSREKMAGWEINGRMALEQWKTDHPAPVATKDREWEIKKEIAEGKISKEAGDALLTGINSQDRFDSDDKKVIDPTDLSVKANRYITLTNQISNNPGKWFTNPNDEEEYKNLSLLFNNSAKTLSDAGVLSKDISTANQQLKDIHSYNNGELFGSKYVDKMQDNGDGKMIIVKSLEHTPKFDQIQKLSNSILKAQKANNKNVTTIGDALASSITVPELFYVPSKETSTGKFTYDLIDDYLTSNIKRTYYKGDAVTYDKTGELKTSDYSGNVDIRGLNDNGWSGSEAGAAPLEFLAKTRGGKPTDYLKDMHVKIEGNKLIVSGIIDAQGGTGKNIRTSAFKGVIGNSDLEGDAANRVQIVINDSNGGLAQIFGNSKELQNHPEYKAFMERANPQLTKVQNAIAGNLADITVEGMRKNVNGYIIENIGKGDNGDNNFRVSLDKGRMFKNSAGKDIPFMDYYRPEGSKESRPIVTADDLIAVISGAKQ